MATARNPIVYALVFLLSYVLVSCKEAEEVAIGAVHAGPGEKVFNVKDYYVPLTKDDDCPGCPEGDEVKSDYTMAFAKAWRAACEHHGKAKVLIPKEDFLIGQLSFTGPCNGSSPATPKIVEILGNIKGSQDMIRYSIPDYWFSFEGIDGLQVIGRGTFDGQGEDELWNCHATKKRDSCTFLPANMLFKEVRNAAVRRITSKNSKGMHVSIENCQNITLSKLDISGPKDKPDTNGIHIFNSTGVRVSKSQISSGDECITIAQNSTNVSINKVTCGPSHGIGVTSVKEYVFPFDPKANRDVRGILVRNSTLTDTENGIRIRIPPGKFKFQASGLVFKDIIMNNVKNPIVIDQGNCSTINSNQTQCDVKISNVHYRNIIGTSASPVALNLTCNKHSPCQNIYLSNVDFKYKGSPLPSICAHAQVGYDGIHPPPCKH